MAGLASASPGLVSPNVPREALQHIAAKAARSKEQKPGERGSLTQFLTQGSQCVAFGPMCVGTVEE